MGKIWPCRAPRRVYCRVVVLAWFFLCATLAPHSGIAADKNEAGSVETQEHRQSALDLEIGGELPGVPAGGVRYISRAELLKLPQVFHSVADDANFAGQVEISGVPLTELIKALGVAQTGKMVVAICVDRYHAHYSQEYLQVHQPILVLRINGQEPANWPTNAEVHGAAMGPFLISHAKFTPLFKIRSHEDEPQIPWGVVRLDVRDEAAVLAAIAPRGPSANGKNEKDGYVIAQQNCFRCHDNKGEGGTKSGRPWPVLAAWAEAAPQRFANYVRNPQSINAKSQMAPSPQYDDATIHALIVYFKTFLLEGKR